MSVVTDSRLESNATLLSGDSEMLMTLTQCVVRHRFSAPLASRLGIFVSIRDVCVKGIAIDRVSRILKL